MYKFHGWYETDNYDRSRFASESDDLSMLAVSDIVLDLLTKGAEKAIIQADLGRKLEIGESDIVAEIWRDGTFNFHWDAIAKL